MRSRRNRVRPARPVVHRVRYPPELERLLQETDRLGAAAWKNVPLLCRIVTALWDAGRRSDAVTILKIAEEASNGGSDLLCLAHANQLNPTGSGCMQASVYFAAWLQWKGLDPEMEPGLSIVTGAWLDAHPEWMGQGPVASLRFERRVADLSRDRRSTPAGAKAAAQTCRELHWVTPVRIQSCGPQEHRSDAGVET